MIKHMLRILPLLLYITPAITTLMAGEITPVLKLGNTTNTHEISLLQTLLNKQLNPSPELPVDGVFGETTKNAVVAFQRENGLKADGIVGTETWKTLLKISVAANARITIEGAFTLRKILDHSKIETATITSGYRTPAEQARIMYENAQKYGADHSRKLYGTFGDKVIDIFTEHANTPKDDAIKAMEAKIIFLGAENVSRHCSNTHDVFDVDPTSVTDREAFETSLKYALDSKWVSKFIVPPKDPAYHIECDR